jgi:alcohol dehydrogenase class IV
MNTFQWMAQTFVGAGIIQKIGKLAPPSNSKHKALITSAADAWCQPINQKIKNLLLSAGWETVDLWTDIEPNPSWNTVNKGRVFCSEHKVDTIFAIGGGSTLDASKMMAKETGIDYLITIPTTTGTGSELNEWAVITNTETQYKESLQTVMPSIAILDPELTLTLPPFTTLLTGIDAFSHALECYVAKTANPITDSQALLSMEMVAQRLSQAVAHGDDLEARTAMLEASMLSGGSMLGVEGLGLMHGIGNVTGGFTHDNHGLILARLLDPVIEFNKPAIPKDKLKKNQTIHRCCPGTGPFDI